MCVYRQSRWFNVLPAIPPESISSCPWRSRQSHADRASFSPCRIKLLHWDIICRWWGVGGGHWGQSTTAIRDRIILLFTRVFFVCFSFNSQILMDQSFYINAYIHYWNVFKKKKRSFQCLYSAILLFLSVSLLSLSMDFCVIVSELDVSSFFGALPFKTANVWLFSRSFLFLLLM